MRSRLALLAVLTAAPAFAQSNIVNADLRVQPAGDLSRTFAGLAREDGPIWIAYAVPTEDPEWNACCYNGPNDGSRCCGRCALEQSRGARDSDAAGTPRGTVRLEAHAIVTLFRVSEHRVDTVRAFSESCEIDAGGRRVYWLDDVQGTDSVKLLAGLAAADEGAARRANDVGDGALMALAAHRERSALDTLIDIARSGRRAHQRGQALFWLAHRAGQAAVRAIADAIETDPDTDVKTRAVFALGQLPADEGVPRLIEVARANRNPKVRQQAIFWLGQSDDSRALEFFEEILTPRPPRR
jgi:hypothetical protein